MKKHIAMLCAVLLTALAAFAPGAAAAGPALTATEAYCIIDADTGLVLAQQNMNEELHPASITLVMDAGCSSSFIFCCASTRPVSASMMQ